MENWDIGARARKQQMDRIVDHEAAQLEERRQQSARDMANHDARRRYLDGLEAAKAAKQRQIDAEIDAELEPRKQFLRNEWLSNHPGKSESDFNRDAWPHLRANLIAERSQRLKQAEMNALQESGLYAL